MLSIVTEGSHIKLWSQYFTSHKYYKYSIFSSSDKINKEIQSISLQIVECKQSVVKPDERKTVQNKNNNKDEIAPNNKMINYQGNIPTLLHE